MHQGLTAKIVLALFFVFSLNTRAQLNKSSEIIETIEDIELQDDTQQQPLEKKPKFDEEFQKGNPAEQAEAEEEIKINEQEAEPELAKPEEEKPVEAADRKELSEEEQTQYEDELEKNAYKNRLKRGEGLEDDKDQFAVDPAQQKSETKEEVMQKPEAPKEEISDSSEPEDRTREYPVEETVESADMDYIPAPSTEKILSREETQRLQEKTEVEIEEDPFIDAITERKRLKDLLKPYRDRRSSWSFQLEVGAGQFEPYEYLSEAIIAQDPLDTYETFYESADTPLAGIGIEIKKNLPFGAIGLQTSMSYFSTSNDAADFSLMVPGLRATLYFDTLFDEPYIVPYASGGYSYFMYSESFDDGVLPPVDVSGETDNFYYSLGVAFQLNWLDKEAARIAYADSGIENSFIFVEGKSYLDQGIMRAEGAPDFSTGVFLSAGARVEF